MLFFVMAIVTNMVTSDGYSINTMDTIDSLAIGRLSIVHHRKSTLFGIQIIKLSNN